MGQSRLTPNTVAERLPWQAVEGATQDERDRDYSRALGDLPPTTKRGGTNPRALLHVLSKRKADAA